jgi:thiamine pyrophosphate-dependent acetolactate synthase large subunit-like protein
MITPLLRTDAVASIARARGDMLTLVTMQAVAPWNALGQADSRNFNVVGCMGSAGSIGLGLALARPHDRVLVLDGDGSLLMQLGTLASVGGRQPANLYHAVFENGIYETSGGQDVPARGTADFSAMALAAGYRHAWRFSTLEQLDRELGDSLRTPGPAFISLQIAGPGTIPGPVPRVPGKAAQAENMRVALSGAPSASEPSTSEPGETRA